MTWWSVQQSRLQTLASRYRQLAVLAAKLKETQDEVRWHAILRWGDREYSTDPPPPRWWCAAEQSAVHRSSSLTPSGFRDMVHMIFESQGRGDLPSGRFFDRFYKSVDAEGASPPRKRWLLDQLDLLQQEGFLVHDQERGLCHLWGFPPVVPSPGTGPSGQF